MSLPRLTVEEKKAALKKAQWVRSRRAEIRERLKKGDLTLGDVLNKANDDTIGRMKVTYLLQSLPKIGKVRSRKIMEEIGIDESRRVRGLGSRQKEALLRKFS